MKTTPALAAAAVLSLAFLFSAMPAPAQNSVRGPAQQPLPMSFGEAEAKAAAKDAAREAQPKFPNKDTAKNRRDNELGTEHGNDGISIGRDAASGDNVINVRPPKREQQQQSTFSDKPIEVNPVVRVRR